METHVSQIKLYYPKGLAQLIATMLLGIWLVPCKQVPSSNPLLCGALICVTGFLGMPSTNVGKLPWVSPYGFCWKNKLWKLIINVNTIDHVLLSIKLFYSDK
jgi:hypothetical protein